MCFWTKTAKCKATVAKKNIIAYKKLITGDNGTLLSPAMKTPWKPNEIKSANMVKTVKNGSVNVGLHCFRTRSGASNSGYSGRVVSVIIPKGAYYFENRSEIVANKMLVLTPELKSILKIIGTKL